MDNNGINHQLWLRRFSKLTCFSTLMLIFVGGMVTSTGSGLAVPDWPLSYGMLFPPMVGGVFYEHGHRMVATLVGLFMLILAVWLGIKENRGWIKMLGYIALAAVIIQGLLGGMTVLMMLPTPVSVSHGVLAQTFFILTIIIAYGLSKEREMAKFTARNADPVFLKVEAGLTLLVFLQLVFGAIMRHTHSGLAIPDFPTMGGKWMPTFSEKMLNWINLWRFDHDYDPVTMNQVVYHFIHRLGALIITIFVVLLNLTAGKKYSKSLKVMQTVYLINAIFIMQIFLGIATVLTQKIAVITSMHVACGALFLGLSVLLLLRISPLTLTKFKEQLFI